ncbi:uncharacterized protein N7515_002610 [Penicillium bovifimosum]|uniref:Uncharacterized protein n=1 Tax=Penicillium bovifimosum TaxID=126998 RepID=A0A9W9L9F1_9EURO|nr:uncharacterized protein N7515_002610 [Penicillium bovifimosum]KAJ5143823.1 hypothetical protein N7515_002610 [Penicillium bovifimosum]
MPLPLSRRLNISGDQTKQFKEMEAEFILVGGAAAVLQGYKRTTTDVDTLIRSQTVLDSLESVEGFEVVAGRLSYRSVIIDLLTTIDDRFTYSQVDGYVRYVHGVPVLQPEYALSVKIRCFYLRSEDSNGLEKQLTDLMDAVFWAKAMKEAGKTISNTCATLFQIGCYHAVLVRLKLEPDDFEILVDVGFGRLIIPWEENTPEQREYYYSLFAPEGTDLLTVPLDN